MRLVRPQRRIVGIPSQFDVGLDQLGQQRASQLEQRPPRRLLGSPQFDLGLDHFERWRQQRFVELERFLVLVEQFFELVFLEQQFVVERLLVG
ncbi:hypothetical protein [Tsuneonella mangrovi]|uniref:hypothetical protein n=1 Tax=Tsuneonella mangrovi TaxID=1982042 RepID=UPI00196A8799|nr:hypothetical protein [Tsuneonella mangrovi]